ncbi:hexokinase-domain-containing protein [Daldinia sp. FL1419]|nr:hexokinase-domain-containing protein [Daldinia sp. FL1419]
MAKGLETSELIKSDDTKNLPPGLQEKLIDIENQFHITSKTLKQITQRFEEELREGLENEGSNIAMNVTWVLGLPSGEEVGEYVTIDLGGTNLRVCLVTLNGQGEEIKIEQHKYCVPPEIKTGTSRQLWDFIADSLDEFIKSYRLTANRDDRLPLGFCFSYPASQHSIDHGILKTWTKGFDIDGVEGEDAARQLRNVLAERNLPLELVALVNDTTGAMVASAYKDPKTVVGAIFGTGCNAAYVENIGSIPKLKTTLPPDTPMAINCEYGAFDNAHRVLPRTKYDETIDRDSPRPGEQAFEKMSAGLYLGEIFRLVVLDLHKSGLIFPGQDATKLSEPYKLDTGFLSGLENDPLETSRTRLEESLNIKATLDEAKVTRRLAEIIATRGARLCSCGVAAICRMKGVTSGHVAADGTVANKHPKFKQRWTQALGEILDWPEDRPEDPITLTSAEDGSGIGAAVISAMTLNRIHGGNTVGIQG